ncbi:MULTISPECIES: hypothetical protein [Vibrio]|uniref:hypothetical protein n=1 Tax=Vibrio TaxID=662 RepID=UPI000C16F68F|nr:MULTISPECIES: hypothetical protein [Vibrio]NAW69082.1 hypothetical protein [Vibrio sp. V28_P6S34P95]NAX06323.1 hypothetical protein [Vibrio sp. V30_P3S12P165]NAX34064.1 hypothetical protein [Vibrio sp. V29_P1S30P107]NAX38670.1 hypothetical protein [Vibrio sp. V27_P1S3P104]NAX40663.1 hypothetical protein [Vibrio sp. V26_P1S5P106]
MSISAISSGYPIIQQSSKMAEEAALDIQKNQAENAKPSPLSFNQVDDQPIEKKAPAPVDNTQAMVNLNQAQQYHRVGTSVIQREQAMIGSLLDIRI